MPGRITRRRAMDSARRQSNSLWVTPQRFEYAPISDAVAVARLTATLAEQLPPPAGAALLIEAPQTKLRCPALGSVTNHGTRRRASDELLWRVTFSAPIEVLEYPDTAFA